MKIQLSPDEAQAWNAARAELYRQWKDETRAPWGYEQGERCSWRGYKAFPISPAHNGIAEIFDKYDFVLNEMELAIGSLSLSDKLRALAAESRRRC
jgi:hypothetical protein